VNAVVSPAALHCGFCRRSMVKVVGVSNCADGAGLVAWYRKTHPRDVARIEREITKELWEET
jgi:hypothetical protein